jgi:DNA-binding MarR family transcriptional regulator
MGKINNASILHIMNIVLEYEGMDLDDITEMSKLDSDIVEKILDKLEEMSILEVVEDDDE